MKRSSRPPSEPACQAELIVYVAEGQQCCAPAVGTRDGRPVCWLHLGAIRQLTFVSSPDDSHFDGLA